MKRYFNKFVVMLMAVMMLLSIPCPALAAEVTEEDFTVEVIPNEEIEVNLPAYLREALNEDEVVPYGLSKPSSSKIKDLSSGAYNFSISTKLNTTIYSNYVFVGHGGAVKFYINDTSTAAGGYTVKVYKKGLVDTTVYTKKNCSHDEATRFSVSFGDANAKVYFAIIPNGTTYIQNNSYIAKG